MLAGATKPKALELNQSRELGQSYGYLANQVAYRSPARSRLVLVNPEHPNNTMYVKDKSLEHKTTVRDE
ncbi:hypothetical protein RRG08_019500 [Elysia crispata]|uniref:Uncharacterized protein n=1 Tax=Elysia crispata TaxID=231223 RepID=A0AAE0YHW2_9GAST|nr:hypothetical protein RRG08_019500 [Elysia crispata]